MKADFPRCETDEGTSTFVSEIQSPNAKSPMNETEEGISIDSSDEHPQNEKAWIAFILFGMTILELLSYFIRHIN